MFGGIGMLRCEDGGGVYRWNGHKFFFSFFGLFWEFRV